MDRKEQNVEDISPPQVLNATNDFIGVEIEKDKEYWLGRVNDHLEKMLHKENKGTKLQITLARHHYARNMVSKARVKIMKRKLKKTLRRFKKRDSLNLLVDASLVVRRQDIKAKKNGNPV